MTITCGTRQSGAIYDPRRVYRYSLWREWDSDLPRVTFIMLNPSTASESTEDPTIRRCLRFAREWGYGSLEVVNLYAYCTVKPPKLRDTSDPIGPENDAMIRNAVARAALVVCAWGGFRLPGDRAQQVLSLLPDPHCLRIGKGGAPCHPLYLPASLTPIPFTKVGDRGTCQFPPSRTDRTSTHGGRPPPGRGCASI